MELSSSGPWAWWGQRGGDRPWGVTEHLAAVTERPGSPGAGRGSGKGAAEPVCPFPVLSCRPLPASEATTVLSHSPPSRHRPQALPLVSCHLCLGQDTLGRVDPNATRQRPCVRAQGHWGLST